jgi:hypothetical protein
MGYMNHYTKTFPKAIENARHLNHPNHAIGDSLKPRANAGTKQGQVQSLINKGPFSD